MKKKSWREKLNDPKGLPRVAEITCDKSARWGRGAFVIPAPLEVDEIMRKVPEGKLITIDGIRKILARKHGTTIACPITTGIFAWIAAYAADEAEREGKKRVTPYWRTLKSNGELNPKYPGGVDNLKSRLKSEGHVVVSKGKRFLVKAYEDYLIRG